MAKYTASPRYVIAGGIEFSADGTYETEDAEKVALLDSLAPMWITRVDEVKTEEPQVVAEVADETAAKPAAKPRKTSAK